MRVLINAASANMGGAFTYLKNLIQWLPVLSPEHQFIVIAPAATKEKLQSEKPGSNIEFKEFPYSNTGGPGRLYFDQVSIPKFINENNIDILFSSTGFGTFYSPCPEIILIRNPVYFNMDFQKKYEELGRSLKRTKFRRWYSTQSIQRADTILFPTDAMKEMVAAHTDLENKYTKSIHYGFDGDRFFSDSSDGNPWKEEMRNWKKEGYKILLNISTYAVHKNFETLIQAAAELQDRGQKFKLLTSTSRDRTKDKDEYDQLLALAKSSGIIDHWVELGYVSYNTLQHIYKESDVYVFPSFTESFGHSLVEAMATGLPVVAADMPVNREVCQPAGLYFSTYNQHDMAVSLENLLTDDQVYDEQSRLSRERSQHFSWKKYTQQLLDEFHHLLDSKK